MPSYIYHQECDCYLLFELLSDELQRSVLEYYIGKKVYTYFIRDLSAELQERVLSYYMRLDPRKMGTSDYEDRISEPSANDVVEPTANDVVEPTAKDATEPIANDVVESTTTRNVTMEDFDFSLFLVSNKAPVDTNDAVTHAAALVDSVDSQIVVAEPSGNMTNVGSETFNYINSDNSAPVDPSNDAAVSTAPAEENVGQIFDYINSVDGFYIASADAHSPPPQSDQELVQTLERYDSNTEVRESEEVRSKDGGKMEVQQSEETEVGNMEVQESEPMQQQSPEGADDADSYTNQGSCVTIGGSTGSEASVPPTVSVFESLASVDNKNDFYTFIYLQPQNPSVLMTVDEREEQDPSMPITADGREKQNPSVLMTVDEKEEEDPPMPITVSLRIFSEHW